MSSASARSNPQVPQATDTQYNVRNAALRGASSAFSKPPVKPKPQVNTYTGEGNGALLAATKVGTGTPRTSTPSGSATPLGRDWTGGSTRSATRSYVSPMRPLSKASSSSTLAVPDEGLFEPVPSPSNIAAKLAAARYSPMKPLPQITSIPVMSEREANERDVLPPPGSVGNVLARLGSTHQVPKVKRMEEARPGPLAQTRRAPQDDKSTDDTSIAPTTSLVNMFEQSQPGSRNASAPVRAPIPQRAVKLAPKPSTGEPLLRQRTKTPPPVKPKPKPLSGPQHSTDGVSDTSASSFKTMRKDTFGMRPAISQSELSAIDNKNILPKPPPKKSSHSRPKSEDMSRSISVQTRRLSSSLSQHEELSSPVSFVSAHETLEDRPKPSLPPPRRTAKPKQEPLQTQRPMTSALPLPKLGAQSKPASPRPPPDRSSKPRRASVSGATNSSGTVYHSNYQRESMKAIAQHMTGQSLSNAIMGAALASSRNASPSRASNRSPVSVLTPPVPSRKHHFNSPFGRSPSPTKPKPPPTRNLRTTMRRDPSSSSDEEDDERYKRKGTRIMGMGRKHPNKHHEGTRKRWRDQITERERKRYEGVWAANKGLFVSTPPSSRSSSQPSLFSDEDPAHDVTNIVAKEIWLRSRLPEHVLEEVWDLVDSRGIGRLKREEFVVGMWLVDQRLKGRKLPIKVSESVWASVRGPLGLKVKVGDRHHHKPHKPHMRLPLP